ncbi:hypothetical protein ACN38_g5589 [Penicillium nordicum]|uniref:Uncharacterized protein n=1 Tax=Penicillium nordicum TaxID=229535 RepID=A0A0M8P215_9EURO|nr:hypothetical protein ACN38_g5589 [Penicillium nordicum]
MTVTIAAIARAWALRWLGPRTPPSPPSPAPECSGIVVVADIPPVPPIRIPPGPPFYPPDAFPVPIVRSRGSLDVLESISDSTSSSLRHRLQRSDPLRAITIGHSADCGCQVCANRRYNLMNPMERGEV